MDVFTRRLSELVVIYRRIIISLSQLFHRFGFLSLVSERKIDAFF
jgi:hypothetical protein